MTNTYGADVLRLYVASMDYADDIAVSERGIKEMSEAYRKIRNTFRYLLGNLEDYRRFDPEPVRPVEPARDRPMGARPAQPGDPRRPGGVRTVRVLPGLSADLPVLLGGAVERLPGRAQGPALRRGPRRSRPPRRAVRAGPAARRPDPTAGPDHPAHGRGVVGLPARRTRQRSSVHLAEFPEPDPRWDDEKPRRPLGRVDRGSASRCSSRWRGCGRRSSSAAPRRPGSGSRPTAPTDGCPIASCWPRSASSRRSRSSPTPPRRARSVQAERSTYAKCERCWNYRPGVGRDAEHPTLCERCVRVIGQMNGQDGPG